MKNFPSHRGRRRAGRTGRERGSFLLEALISVLIVAFGLLGLIGLQARSIQNVDDAQYRGEAALLANGVLGQMWTWDMTTLATDFDSTPGTGAGYKEFQAVVGQRLPGAAAIAPNPVVTVTPGVTPNSANVLIQVFWQPPGETSAHRYELAATVGLN